MLPSINLNASVNSLDIGKQIASLRSQLAALRDGVEEELSSISYDQLDRDLRNRIDRVDESIALAKDESAMTVNSLTANMVTTQYLTSKYITATDIAAEYASFTSLANGTTTINGGCITTGTIDASKVTVTNLNASNITSGTISTSRLEAKVLTSDDISTFSLSANQITSGTIDASVITVSNISADNITSGTINASLINVQDLFASGLSSALKIFCFDICTQKLSDHPSHASKRIEWKWSTSLGWYLGGNDDTPV